MPGHVLRENLMFRGIATAPNIRFPRCTGETGTPLAGYPGTPSGNRVARCRRPYLG